ncbi:MAG: ATP-binding protein [Desulfonatronovibrionaceae bacterium]
MNRYIFPWVKKDLSRKMVLITGPRQVGKTYLARQYLPFFPKPQYLNFDVPADAGIIKKQTWPPGTDLLVFDELHKMKGWKKFLKGVFDGREENQAILVTGSARMETFRQSGESLAGRYFHYHLLPLSVSELAACHMPPQDALEVINELGGFPEPCLTGSADYAARWRKQYYTDLVREDILEFSRISELKTMKFLLEMLRSRVGSSISFSSIARDLQVAPQTVQSYISILESLYIVFLVRPYHKNVARSILKEPKLYFYDTGLVLGNQGARLENSFAVSLLKHVHLLNDTAATGVRLHYLRTKDGKEIDFALVNDSGDMHIIEVKLSDESLSRSLIFFKNKFFQNAQCTQAVMNLKREQYRDGIHIRNAAGFLAEL